MAKCCRKRWSQIEYATTEGPDVVSRIARRERNAAQRYACNAKCLASAARFTRCEGAGSARRPSQPATNVLPVEGRHCISHHWIIGRGCSRFVKIGSRLHFALIPSLHLPLCQHLHNSPMGRGHIGPALETIITFRALVMGVT